MRITAILIVAALTGCNYAVRWDADVHPFLPAEIASSFDLSGPDQTALSSTDKAVDEDAKTTRTQERGASTTHTQKSKAELEAENSRWLMWMGILGIAAGVGLMVARFYTKGIAIPTWAPRLVIGIGAGLVAFGSLSPDFRNWAVATIAAMVLGWMYYGSKNHNHKILTK